MSEGVSVGYVSVRVRPDTDQFAQKLKKKLKAIEEKSKLTVQVKYDLDDSAIQTRLKELKQSVTLEFDTDALRDVEKRIKVLSRKHIKLSVDDDALKRAERTLKALSRNVQVGINFDERKLQALNNNGHKVPLEVDHDKLANSIARAIHYANTRNSALELDLKPNVNRQALDSALERVQFALRDLELKVPATLQGEQLREELREIETYLKARRDWKIGIPVELEDAIAFRAELQRLVTYAEAQAIELSTSLDSDQTRVALEQLASSREVTFEADSDTTLARLKLSALSRPRFVELFITINKASYLKALAMLNVLSGARATGNLARNFLNIATNLDNLVLTLGPATAGIIALGAGALSATAHVATLATSLVKILPAVAALPGIGAGLTVFALGSADALSGFEGALQNVGLEIKELYKLTRAAAGETFWEQATRALPALIQNVIVPFATEYVNAMAPIGRFWEQLFNGITDGVANAGGMSALFAPLTTAIETAATGAYNLSEGIITLGTIGAQYLPALADGFVDVSAKFNDWAHSGAAETAISVALEEAKNLWQVLVETWGILQNISIAAGAAGGAGLGDLANGLAKINAGLAPGTAGGGALTQYFYGANKAMGIMGDGLGHFGGLFIKFSETASHAMITAGRIVERFMTYISVVLGRPKFMQGLLDMLDGLHEGISGVFMDSAAPLGDALGSLMSLAGTFASNIGRVLGVGIQVISPFIEDLAGSAQDLIPILADWLVNALIQVGVWVRPLIDWVSQFTQQNPELAAQILVVVGAITALVIAITPVIKFFVDLLAAIGPLIPLLAGTGEALAAVAEVIGIVIAVAAVVIGFVLTLAAGFTELWNSSEQFRDSVTQFWGAIVEYFRPAVDYFEQTVIPKAQEVWQAFLNMCNKIGEALAPLFDVVSNIFIRIVEIISDFVTQVWEYLQPVRDFLLNLFAPAFEWAANVAIGAFEWLGDAISGAINLVTGYLQIVLDVLNGDWHSAFVNAAMWVRDFGVYIVETASSYFSTFTANISKLGEWVGNFFSDLWGGLGDGLGDALEGILNFFRNLPQNIRNTLSNFSLNSSGWNLLVDFGNGMVRAWNNAVRNQVNNLMDAVRSFFPFSPAKTGPFSGRGYTPYSGQALVSDFGKGMLSRVGEVRSAASAVVGAAQLNGASFSLSGVEGRDSNSDMRAALEGMTFRTDTGFGEVIFTAYNDSSRRERR